MRFNKPLEVLAVRDKDGTSLLRAASGGAFSILARPIIASGGVVFGAKMFDSGEVRHVAAQTPEETAGLQGSAYVQSDTADIFDQVVAAVRAGRPTLFVGTPCQCAAIASYVEARLPVGDISEIANLFVCDLICHGVPSGELFRAHQEWLARKHRADDGIHSFRFRTKRKGWGLNYYYYYYRHGKKHEVCKPGDCDPYYAAFLRGDIYRECCYRCPFAQNERITDFTIGDYWGIGSAHPEFYNPAGVSVMLVNSEKAVRYFEDWASSECEYIVSNMQLAAKENHNLSRPTGRTAIRDSLLATIARCRASGNMDTLFEEMPKPRPTLKRVIKRLIPARTRAKLKAIIRGKNR